MSSLLYVVEAKDLQSEIVKKIKEMPRDNLVYITLNKNYLSTEQFLKKEGINSENIFFIDSVSQTQEKNIVYIPPNDIIMLEYAVKTFIKEIKADSFIVIDSLATLVIYNEINKVAGFVRELTKLSEKRDITFLAFSQKTEEELLSKVYNFFDMVNKK